MKTYFVVTTEGSTYDDAGTEVENAQILDIIESPKINTVKRAAEYAERRINAGKYGNFGEFSIYEVLPFGL